MKNILFFGTYDPLYARNRVLAQACLMAGYSITHMRTEHVGLRGYIDLCVQYMRRKEAFSIMLVLFPGQKVMFLARLLFRGSIIFDAFTSHYGGYILDRKKAGTKSIRAWWYRFLDTWSCKLAHKVLLDTQAHIDFFMREFKLPRELFHRIFVGTDESVFFPRASSAPHSEIVVHFHGTFIPLHGVEVIVEAMRMLRPQTHVRAILIGKGQTYVRVREMAHEVPSITFIDSVSYKNLAEYIANSDICLGIFGTSQKTDLVIPNKIFEAAASGRAIISADTPAMRELFDDKAIYYVPAGDARALAHAIQTLADNHGLRTMLGEGARLQYVRQASTRQLAIEIDDILSSYAY